MIQTMSMASMSNFRHDVFSSTFRPRPQPRHERHCLTHAVSASPGHLPPPPVAVRVPSSLATTSAAAVWVDRSPVSPSKHHTYDWSAVDHDSHLIGTFQSVSERRGPTAAGHVEIPVESHSDGCVVVNDVCYVNEVGRTMIDRHRLTVARDRVIAGGFYHGPLSAADARRRLADSPIGTFLVRDSSERARYPFAVTVKIASTSSAAVSTATSIRVTYEAGRFRFDGVPEAVDRLPTFDCVVELIRHHVEETKERAAVASSKSDARSGGVIAFVDHNAALGKSTEANILPVVLSRPLPVSGAPSTLKHLCRRRISSLLDGRSVTRLHLQPSLRQYLLDYPYDL